MKKIFISIFFMISSSSVLSMMNETFDVRVSYDPLIDKLPLEELRTVRSRSEQEKKILFAAMQDNFPLEQAIARAKECNDPQIVLWFTNYFGSVTKKTLSWYQENLFDKLKATFWLTDLKAWALMSVDQAQLKQIYGPLVAKIVSIQQSKLQPCKELSNSECPLLSMSSEVIDKDLNRLGNYKPHISKEFFKWLVQLKDQSLVSDDICNQLCKEYPRQDSLRFSLAEIGYNPELFNRSIEKLQVTSRATMLEADFSMIYPILQYMEGVYYAYKVVEKTLHDGKKECSLVFMLPNKEFAYYTVPGEQKLFKSFESSLQSILRQSLEPESPVTVNINFQPFAYGSDFYDAPYKLSGSRLKKSELLKQLSQTFKKEVA